jgi:3-deoxy-D-manno-octulosonic-acid transferase
MSAPLPLSLRAWRWVSPALTPLLRYWVKRRIADGKEDPRRVAERFAVPGRARPDGRLVWMHGASVGESQMLLRLGRALRLSKPDVTLLITTQTWTAARMIEADSDPHVIHQYLPFDTPGNARAFLAYWKPSLGIIAESEIWPNLILAAEAADIPLTLVNARMTEKSRRNWGRMPALSHALLERFSMITAADDPTAATLTTLARRPVAALGNLKRAADPLPVDEVQLARWQERLEGRTVWLAASTHMGEEQIAADANRLLDDPARLVIIAPRHPERGDAIAALLRQTGYRVAQRSKGETVTVETEIYLADTMGEMGLWYRLSAVTLIGGSLMDGIGGHNPLEPAMLDVPMLSGPYVFNFAEIYAELWSEAGAQQVRTAEDIAAALTEMSPQARELQVRRAARVAARGPSVLVETLEGLLPFLLEKKR